MKYNQIMVCLVINIFLSFGMLLAQGNCGEITRCPSKEYCYKFCNTQTQQLFDCWCALDPNNSGYGAVYKPMKSFDFPICMVYEDNTLYPNTINLSKMIGEIETFNKANIPHDMELAQNAWNCLCGWQNSPCRCTVYVRFSDNAMELRGDLRVRIAYAQYTYYNDNCEMKCSQSSDKTGYIFLNASTDFKGGTFGGYPFRTFTNQAYFDQNPNYLASLKEGLITLNLTDILTHEFGHQYGISHQNNDDGTPRCGGYTGQIMKSKYNRPNQSKAELSLDDICMFKKLYCMGLTPVEEMNNELEDYNHFPNPADRYTVCNFEILGNNELVNICIYNSMGDMVLNPINKYYSFGNYKEIINISELSAGVYFIKLIIGKKVVTNNLIILR